MKKQNITEWKPDKETKNSGTKPTCCYDRSNLPFPRPRIFQTEEAAHPLHPYLLERGKERKKISQIEQGKLVQTHEVEDSTSEQGSRSRTWRCWSGTGEDGRKLP